MLAGLAGAGSAGVLWGVVEACALRMRTVEVPLPRMAPELDGLRVLHVSDVHAGYGPGLALLRRVCRLAPDLRPDLLVVTGDLVARRRALAPFNAALRELAELAPSGAFAVLGNHDHGEGNDPFAQGSAPVSLDGVDLLAAGGEPLETRIVPIRGVPVQIVGVESRAYLRSRHLDLTPPPAPGAGLRLLLCHYPRARRRAGAYDLVLAGHLHGGQINLPVPGGVVSLAHPTHRVLRGLVGQDPVMHVSPGLGTTFLPFRFLARPEATLLVLRARVPHGQPIGS